MFTEESAVVKSWVRLIKAGTYSLEHVPELSNLKEVVNGAVEGME